MIKHDAVSFLPTQFYKCRDKAFVDILAFSIFICYFSFTILMAHGDIMLVYVMTPMLSSRNGHDIRNVDDEEGEGI